MHTRVGFVGHGFVLRKCMNLCKTFGLVPSLYTTIDDVNCDVLFAIRVKEIIPQDVIDKVPLGIVLVHYSKLPNYRGYYPINQAIRHGEDEIGVSLFYAESGIDTGDIIAQETIKIGLNETVAEIYEQCDSVAIRLFANNIMGILSGTAPRAKQVGIGSVFKEVDLTSGVTLSPDIKTIHNFIRSRTGKEQERAYIEDKEYRLYFDKTTLVKR